MNKVMFDLQAAVMVASVSSGSSTTEIPDDGSSFSDVLAAQKELITEDAVSQAAENDGIDADMPEDMAKQTMSEILDTIEKVDEGIRKALMRLLETVLKATRGTDDDKERKTDLFMLLSDGSAEFAENEDNMLLGCELLSQTGLMLEAEFSGGIKTDGIIPGLESIITGIFGKDTDEETISEFMASMMDIPTGQFMTAGADINADAVKSAVEFLTAPKQVITELDSQNAVRMEQLYADIKDISVKVNEEFPEVFRLGFTSVKINNASEQVAAIGNDDSEDVIPDAMAGTQTVVTAEVSVPGAISESAAESIQVQVNEVITEKLVSIEGDNGTEELTMILKPENLGEVAVKIIKENGAVTVLLSAQYEEVGKALADRAALLGTGLQNQNYNVKEVQVVAAGNAAEQMGLDFTNQGFGFSRESNREQNSSYRSVSGINGIDETETIEETAKMKEAKLWTTA